MEGNKPASGQEDFVYRGAVAAGLVNYQAGSIVSRTVIDKTSGTVTLFAFAEGQDLSEHTALFDALVYIFDGEADIAVSGNPIRLKAGGITLMPAHAPHELKASKKFKMMLIMVKA